MCCSCVIGGQVRYAERRGGEAYDLLQALNTGHPGTLSTIHASSAHQALARLTSCVLQASVHAMI
jgi:type IV secretion system protein VirB11